MEEKGEQINGSMLVKKRKRFEERMNVPETEWLTGEGCEVFTVPPNSCQNPVE
jgi:hypothetical protein